MKLTHQFHEMESKFNLFDLGKNIDLPLWDIIRYSVYVKYYYPSRDRALQKVRSNQFNGKYYFKLFLKILNHLPILLFKKGEVIFFTSSRFKKEDDSYYDVVASPFISSAKNRGFAIERTFNGNIRYPHIFNMSFVLKKLVKFKLLTNSDLSNSYQKIEAALTNTFGECHFTKEELKSLLLQYNAEYRYYKFIFRFKKVKKIFISTGNPKGHIRAAKEMKVKTYLLQHAGIEFDEIDYSYPKVINEFSNILYPEVLLTFGDYWGKNNNIPVSRKVTIGNDNYAVKLNCSEDQSILVISTIIHGRELSILTKDVANNRQDIKFVFKLHPNDFHLKSYYEDFFQDNKNVRIVSSEEDTNELIARSQLVILIVSAVLYQALHQNKKVAVYKRINYERNKVLSNQPNMYFFESVAEIDEILSQETIKSHDVFYESMNHSLLEAIVNE